MKEIVVDKLRLVHRAYCSNTEKKIEIAMPKAKAKKIDVNIEIKI